MSHTELLLRDGCPFQLGDVLGQLQVLVFAEFQAPLWSQRGTRNSTSLTIFLEL